MRHKAMLRRAIAAKPGQDKAAMFVQIVTDAYGAGARLAWGDFELPDPQLFPDFKVLARFACYPVKEDGTVPEVAPPVVDWPFPVSAHVETP